MHTTTLRLKELSFFLLLILWSGCEKWDLEKNNFPLVTTFETVLIDDSESSAYLLSGSITGLAKKGTFVLFGHLVLEGNGTPTLDEYDIRLIESGTDDQPTFVSKVKNLAPEIEYQFRAFAIVEEKVFYGEIFPLTTNPLSVELQIISTQNLFLDIDNSSVDVTYQIKNIPGGENGLKVTNVGLVWSEQTGPNPQTDPFITQGSVIIPGPQQTFTERINNLPQGIYNLRAFLQVGSAYYFSEDTCLQIGGFWVEKERFPLSQGVSNATSFGINGKGYVLGGQNPTPLDDLWEYDPKTNSWTQKSAFPGGKRSSMVSFVIGSYAYAGLGRSIANTLPKSFFKYDPSNNEWSNISLFPGVGRESACAFPLNGFGYVGTGTTDKSNANAALNDFWIYVPQTNAWSIGPSFPGNSKCFSAAAFSIDDTAYAGLGYTIKSSVIISPQSDFYKIQQGGSWTYIPNQGILSVPYQGTATNSYGYIVGSFEESSPDNFFFEFDPSTEIWSPMDKIPIEEGDSRYEGILFALDNRIYFGTGATAFPPYQYQSSFYKYTPLKGCN